MSIYNGNQKINMSGIDKVYVGNTLVYQKSEPLRQWQVSWARSWLYINNVNGDAFTRTAPNTNAWSDTGSSVSSMYIAYKIDDGSSSPIWTTTAYRTGFTTSPAGHKVTICVLAGGGAIGTGSSYNSNQDARITLPSSNTPGYTLISNTQMGHAQNDPKHGRCRRVIFEYTGTGNITITSQSTKASAGYWQPRLTISIK